MKRMIAFVFVAFVLVACAPTVRYSLSELESYPPQIQELIKRGEVAPGMTFQQVRHAWGAPNRVIVKGADDQGRFIEEWIYAKYRVIGRKAVFADGKLIQAYGRVTRSDVRDIKGMQPASSEATEQPDLSGEEQPLEEEEIRQ